MASISVITPTAGKRPRELGLMIKHTEALLWPCDEHIIIWDGRYHSVPTSKYAKHIFRTSRDSVFGNIQRDWGAMHAQGELLVYCDDDDMLAPEGIAALHSSAAEHDTCYIFKMKDRDTIYTAAFGGPQLVLPNQDDIPRWATDNKYEADQRVIHEAMQKYRTVECPQLLCVVRPNEDDNKVLERRP